MLRNSSLLLIVLVVVIALAQFSTQTSANFTETEKTRILADHNNLRIQLSRGLVQGQPQASNMVLMSWDAELAANAQTWAENCQFIKSQMSDRVTSQCDFVGENMWASTSPSYTADVTSSWISEKVNYNFAANTCAAGQQCGHYTQVAWATSTKVGCGRAICPDQQFQTIVVCHYCPAGNMNGVRPYIAGKPKITL